MSVSFGIFLLLCVINGVLTRIVFGIDGPEMHLYFLWFVVSLQIMRSLPATRHA